jgi:two-component system, OmpR family, alkaline phosphatase synthesis response regulator PhoP
MSGDVVLFPPCFGLGNVLANSLPASDTSCFAYENTLFISTRCSGKPGGRNRRSGKYPTARKRLRLDRKVLMEKILIVEDDQAVQKALKRLFESAGYTVEISRDGKSALDMVRTGNPTAMVLDLRLPTLSGKDVCVRVRQQLSALPIIILSASTDVVDKVMLLELGADDYVTKPFSPRELLARVRAVIRSTRKPIIHDEAKFDGICVDFTKMEVTREGQPVALTEQEFKILKFLFHNQERDISRHELLQDALGYQDYPSLRTVDNHILKLRQKLERDPENPAHFLTKYREGYSFVR